MEFRRKLFSFFYTLTFVNCFYKANGSVQGPNIVIIMADDMGFDDVSFRGSNEFLTPNIDALAYSGVILKNFYASAMCTPSRAALLTGKYPINTGMQHYVIPNDQPWGLPLNETTMAEIFQKNGYYTSLFGKWHLGFSRKAYTPTLRGFDHHFGYLGAYIDYYDHSLYSPSKSYARGHDFRRGLNTTHEHVGAYVTDVLTSEAIRLLDRHNFTEKPLLMILSHLAPHSGNEDEPLQAPQEEIKKFNYIPDKERKIYAAMMSRLDKNVGQLIEALEKKKLLNNTILLFFSDNGGPTIGMHSTTASNYPLRGQKNSPWEGALRSSAAIWSSRILNPGSVSYQNLYIADLLPTLAAAAGIPLDMENLDGLNLWEEILTSTSKDDREIVHNIDEIFNYVSYMKGHYKFVNGTTSDGIYDGWLGKRPIPDSNENDPRSKKYEEVIKATSVWQKLQGAMNRKTQADITDLRSKAEIQCKFPDSKLSPSPCKPLEAPCLFDLDADPCEQENLFKDLKYAKLLTQIQERVEYFRSNARTPNNKPADKRCDPKFYHYEWTWWEDERNLGTSRSKINNWIWFWGLSLMVLVMVLKLRILMG